MQTITLNIQVEDADFDRIYAMVESFAMTCEEQPDVVDADLFAEVTPDELAVETRVQKQGD